MGTNEAKQGTVSVLRGRVWKYGDNVDTDAIIPARYLNVSTPEELAAHCMEDVDATFVGQVQVGRHDGGRRQLWVRFLARARSTGAQGSGH